MALHYGDHHFPVSLEVTLNNLLRKIWKLPWHCHTSILHFVSILQNLFNVGSSMLCQKARSTGIPLICDAFTEAPQLSYTTFGFINMIDTGESTLMLIYCAHIL